MVLVSSYLVEGILGKLEFFMDVSPNWWISNRQNEPAIRKHVIAKFARDFYPRIVINRGKKEDIGDLTNFIRQKISSKIINGDFEYEFKPEEEDRKVSYIIKNGNVLFSQRCNKQSARIRILIDGSLH